MKLLYELVVYVGGGFCLGAAIMFVCGFLVAVMGICFRLGFELIAVFCERYLGL